MRTSVPILFGALIGGSTNTALDQRLAELRAEYGTPPNIIHVMWDDTSFGDVGIPAIK